MIKKLLLATTTTFILFLPFKLFAAGSGTMSDPYTTIAEIDSYIQTANCGNTVYLQSGTYTTGFIMDAACSSGSELTVSVSNGIAEDLGGATFTAGTIDFTGAYQVLRGFYFDGTSDGITVSTGDNNLITECKWHNASDANGAIDIGLGQYAQNNEISYCTWIWTQMDSSYGIRVNFRHADGGTEILGNTGNHIHHIYVRGQDAGGGNYEFLQVGRGSSRSDFGLSGQCTFEYAFLEDCASGNELLSIKTSDNILRNIIHYNPGSTLHGFQCGGGAITIRGGENNLIENIYGYYTQLISTWYNGIRVYDDNNTVRNVYLEQDGGANATAGLVYYSGDAPAISGQDATTGLVAENITIVGDTRNGVFYDDDGTVQPQNNTFRNIIIESTYTGNILNLFSDQGSNNTLSDNLIYCDGGCNNDGEQLSGVTEYTQARYAFRNTGYSFNMLYPSIYAVGGNYNALSDIEGETWVAHYVGCDYPGQPTYAPVQVGVSWDGDTKYMHDPESISSPSPPNNPSENDSDGGCFLNTAKAIVKKQLQWQIKHTGARHHKIGAPKGPLLSIRIVLFTFRTKR